jgi:hypothetical protein
VATRYFTPEEANELLAAIRPLTERMVEHRRRLLEVQRRQAELAQTIMGNGGLQLGELRAVHQRVEREAAGVARCLEAIHELGAVVKDTGRGLVDFPARREDEDVLLCWQLGEAEITHWHGLEEGFQGRKPL